MAEFRVALIEDEKHKASRLMSLLDVIIDKDHLKIEQLGSVRDAVIAVEQREFELIILDIALPTFNKEAMIGAGGKAQQPAGGLEVLRSLKYDHKSPPVLVLTQYFDIPFDDGNLPIVRAKKKLSAMYNQNVIGALQYSESGIEWETKFKHLVGGCYASFGG